MSEKRVPKVVTRVLRGETGKSSESLVYVPSGDPELTWGFVEDDFDLSCEAQVVGEEGLK